MRFMLKVLIPVESGNAAAKAGKLGTIIHSILADLKPEAAYFTDSDGQRAGFIFFDMQDPSQIPAIAEPWFQSLNASIELHPAMIPDDLTKAASAHREGGEEICLIGFVRQKTSCVSVNLCEKQGCLRADECLSMNSGKGE